jgi:TPR repeat protein
MKRGISMDLRKAIYYSDLAANQGFAQAQYRFGICLLTCMTPSHNIADIFRDLILSAENHHPDGQFAIACMAEDGIRAFSSVDLLTAAQF